jgi:hypothetical protein
MDPFDALAELHDLHRDEHEEAAELALADLIDMFARGMRQSFRSDSVTAWRPEEVR